MFLIVVLSWTGCERNAEEKRECENARNLKGMRIRKKYFPLNFNGIFCQFSIRITLNKKTGRLF
jgi:hypothetical protein